MKKFKTVKRVNVLKNGNVEIVLQDHKDESQSSIILVYENSEITGWCEVFTPTKLNHNKDYIAYEVEHE